MWQPLPAAIIFYLSMFMNSELLLYARTPLLFFDPQSQSLLLSGRPFICTNRGLCSGAHL
ncbi:hypothetical protein GIB67_034372 [Kingdonia uniflora]|uniref:Uncharacterized protein n=1 Tax=Kingdonia uniflora TaxID=39325 RepID=A0A7J7NSF6_9MAGN|nr:hypothetical protein GIB67_034372 [Kingdonia uniflora]